MSPKQWKKIYGRLWKKYTNMVYDDNPPLDHSLAWLLSLEIESFKGGVL